MEVGLTSYPDQIQNQYKICRNQEGCSVAGFVKMSLFQNSTFILFMFGRNLNVEANVC